LELGGETTLQSYGIDLAHAARLYGSRRKLADYLRRVVPAAHLEFLRALPVLIETPRYVFVHAGMRPGVAAADQSERDLMWMRYGAPEDEPRDGPLIVHGHTPVRAPHAIGRRICLDSGAYFSGTLSAARFWQGEVTILS
jgi:serine/threonine protein phosphatase 1